MAKDIGGDDLMEPSPGTPGSTAPESPTAARGGAHRPDEADPMRSEASPRDTERLYRRIVETANEGIWLLDADQRTTFVNEKMAEMLGYRAEEMLGRSAWDFTFAEDHDEGRRRWERRRGGEWGRGEFRLRRKDGAGVWVRCSTSPVHDADGRFSGALGMFADISEQKRAEGEARRLAPLVENSQDFIGICDLHLTPVYVNGAGLRMVGLGSLEEARGASVGDFFFPEDRAFIADEFFPAVLRDGHGEVEIRFRHFRTGEAVWVTYHVLVLRDDAGEPTGLATISRDITAHKRAEEALHRRSERLRLLGEAAAVLLATDEPDAMMRALFEKLAPHFGLDAYFNFMADEAGGCLRLVSCIGVPEEVGRAIERLEYGQAVCGRVALTRRPIVAAEIQRSDDPMVQLVKSLGLRTYACNPLLADGTLLGTLSFASRTRDRFEPEELEFLATVSHYVTSAYVRLRLIDRLRDADRRKDEFLATLAHELRNPLAPIRNALQIMRMDGGDPAAVGEARTLMERQVAHMVRLIDDLMDVSRITRGRLELRRQRVELAAVVRAAVEASRPLVDAAGHELAVTLPARPTVLDADPTRLAQVFSNLLNNAAKYTEPGGDIALVAERQGSDVVVTVRDNGVGIPPEMLPRVFDPFTQVDGSLERSQGGLGIGLTLVKRLVEMHGGLVEAGSGGHGSGSEFSVRLPIVVEAPGQRSGDEAGAGPAGGAVTRRILVVDDSRDSARTLARLLTLMGHETRTAHDGGEAVEAAERDRPEVILLDIGLPVMNGYDVARAIRARPWGDGVVIVALTGWGQESDRRRSREAGIDRHLVKPVDPAELVKLLAEVRPASNVGAAGPGP